MDIKKQKELSILACKLRKCALMAIEAANSGHCGGSLSVMDILISLYFDKLNINPQDPKWDDRDRFVLSKGHCTPALYSVLAEKGYFPAEDLEYFRHIGSYLSGHAEMNHVPGVDMSTGSLGQGLSAAVGMALAGKYKNKNYKVFAVLGDGEIQEGQVWEAAMAAAHFKLDNLIAFVDNNNLQIDGTISEVMSPLPIDEKFKAFGWKVIKADGHNFKILDDAIQEAVEVKKGKPAMIVCKTIKGKGVSYMEDNLYWHGNVPNKDQFEKAYEDMDALLKKVEVE